MGLTEHSLEVVVRDAQGRIKDSRFVKQFGEASYEFIPNQRYLNKLNNSKHPWRIHLYHGKWTIKE